jgi:hypothetical protein
LQGLTAREAEPRLLLTGRATRITVQSGSNHMPYFFIALTLSYVLLLHTSIGKQVSQDEETL